MKLLALPFRILAALSAALALFWGLCSLGLDATADHLISSRPQRSDTRTSSSHPSV